MAMTHASVFSGIGGPEIAAAMLGWENLFHCEIADFPRKVLQYWFPNAKSYKDVKKTDFKEWKDKVDVLSGGFPCQPFSYSGKRKGAGDSRYLWREMCRVINEVRPTWCVCENVLGISTMVFQSENVNVASQKSLFGEVDYMERRERFILEEICKQFTANGYSVQPFAVPALAVGAPHRRDRIFLVAHRDSEERICTTDTDSCGSQQRDNSIQSQIPNGEKSVSNGRQWDVDRMQSRERWRDFPSVSAVYRGNDGFPFDVDNLSIPFNKWRSESLKAYGNAIVPQVIYEIFYYINQIENGKEN